MTTKKLKFQPGDQVLSLDRGIFDSCRTEAFWRGVLDGLSPHKFLVADCKKRMLLGKEDSVYQAWIEVGKLLDQSMTEYETNAEAAQARVTDNRAKELTSAN